MGNRNLPINKRSTNYTGELSQELDKFIEKNEVPICKIDVSINISTPFPTLNAALSSSYTSIIDPHTALHFVEEHLPNLSKDDSEENASILFEAQSIRIIESSIDAFLNSLQSCLRDFFPRTEDIKTSFLKILDQKKLQYDSLGFNRNYVDEFLDDENILQLFNDIVSDVTKEEE